jgi:hypothetical protein
VQRATIHNSTSTAMTKGQALEHTARRAALAELNKTDPTARIDTCGLLKSTSKPFIGASPDGLVWLRSDAEVSAMEIKCSDSETSKPTTPPSHQTQLMMQMFVLSELYKDKFSGRGYYVQYFGPDGGKQLDIRVVDFDSADVQFKITALEKLYTTEVISRAVLRDYEAADEN